MSAPAQPRLRIQSLDAWRGAVMILMALDHVRDFLHGGVSPTDMAETTPILFFTRWFTHFCLPVFMFAAGIGAFLWARNRTRAQLSRFLWTRGLWFILLELTVMRLAYDFNFSLQPMFLLLILWIFGVCMIVMAALVHLPLRWLAALSLATILLHNLLDPITAARFGAWAWAWNFFHQPGVFPVAGHLVLVSYPLVPWIAVMALGFCFGRVFLLDEPTRRRIMVRLGLAATVAFVVLRAINRYGDPAPWSAQKSTLFTALSFLNCTKYPASLDFLLMTLGPALLVLAWFNTRRFSASNPLIVFGRVPFFYFVLHFYAVHILTLVLALFGYGKATFGFIFNLVPTMGGPAKVFPPDFDWKLWVVYLGWVLVVAALYPVCRWYAGVKARRRDWWLSYL